MTLGVTTPDGFATVLNFGFANADARTPITADTLFQIGSISKVDDRGVAPPVRRRRAVQPDRPDQHVCCRQFPLPRGQHDPGPASARPCRGPSRRLRRCSPTAGCGPLMRRARTGIIRTPAYDMLGKLAEHFGGKPLNRLLAGAHLRAARHAPQPRRDHRRRPDALCPGLRGGGPDGPFARGLPLAPAAWVDVTFGAGSVASTADDMNRFFRLLANAAQGRGGLGLSPERARAFTTHAVPSDTPG